MPDLEKLLDDFTNFDGISEIKESGEIVLDNGLIITFDPEDVDDLSDLLDFFYDNEDKLHIYQAYSELMYPTKSKLSIENFLDLANEAEDLYAGDFKNPEDFAQDLYDADVLSEDFLIHHIDWGSVVNELNDSYMFYDYNHGTLVFQKH